MIAATHNLVIYSHTLVPMRRTLLFPLFAILFVTLFDKCLITNIIERPTVKDTTENTVMINGAAENHCDSVDSSLAQCYCHHNQSPVSALTLVDSVMLSGFQNIIYQFNFSTPYLEGRIKPPIFKV